MSDQAWQASDLVAPQDRSALPFAPWFPVREQAVAAPTFNDWDLKRDAALARAREEAEALARAQAEARAQAADVAAELAPVHTQELSDDELERVRAEAFAQGQAQGREDAQAEWAQERAQQAALMQEVLQQWQGFRTNTTAWFDPLKRLSLAVGEQLARAQLSLHPEQLHALIARCAESLSETRSQVLVHVHPDDLVRLQALDVRWPEDWQWVGDARLGVGSVRLSTDDTEVEDLMSHRLSVLAQQLLDPHLPQVDPDQAPVAEAVTAAASSAPLEEAQAVLPRQEPVSMSERAAHAAGVQDVEPRSNEEDPPFAAATAP